MGEWTQRVDDNSFISIWGCLLVGLIAALIFTGIGFWAAYDDTRPQYEVDHATPKKDGFGNTVYGEKISDGEEMDFRTPFKFGAWGGVIVTLLVYMSNFSKGFRDFLGSVLDNLFS